MNKRNERKNRRRIAENNFVLKGNEFEKDGWKREYVSLNTYKDLQTYLGLELKTRLQYDEKELRANMDPWKCFKISRLGQVPCVVLNPKLIKNMRKYSSVGKIKGLHLNDFILNNHIYNGSAMALINHIGIDYEYNDIEKWCFRVFLSDIIAGASIVLKRSRLFYRVNEHSIKASILENASSEKIKEYKNSRKEILYEYLTRTIGTAYPSKKLDRYTNGRKYAAGFLTTNSFISINGHIHKEFFKRFLNTFDDESFRYKVFEDMLDFTTKNKDLILRHFKMTVANVPEEVIKDTFRLIEEHLNLLISMSHSSFKK